MGVQFHSTGTDCPIGNPSKASPYCPNTLTVNPHYLQTSLHWQQRGENSAHPIIHGLLQCNLKLCVLLSALPNPGALVTSIAPIYPKAEGALWFVHVSLSHRTGSLFIPCTRICILQWWSWHLLQRAVDSLRKIPSSIHLWHSLQPAMVPSV